MQTRCPHCDARFRVSAEHLRQAHGQVICGQCEQVFNALETLLDDNASPDLEQTGETNQPVLTTVDDLSHDAEPGPVESIDDSAEELAAETTVTIAGEPDRTGNKSTVKNERDDTELDYELPEILQDSTATAGRHKFLLGSVVTILLLVIMLLQVIYFWRNELLPRYEFLRPVLQTMCETTGCQLPLRKNLERITLIDREVRSHPVNEEALQITATIINTAEYAQSFPIIRITLSNRHGRIIASRDFQPADYLSENIDINKGLTPKLPLHIELEVLDPGKDAVGFTFEFF